MTNDKRRLGFGRFIRFSDEMIDVPLEGDYMGYQANPDAAKDDPPGQFALFTQEYGLVRFNWLSQLDPLRLLPIGTDVGITYKGRVRTNGGRSVSAFEIEVDADILLEKRAELLAAAGAGKLLLSGDDE